MCSTATVSAVCLHLTPSQTLFTKFPGTLGRFLGNGSQKKKTYLHFHHTAPLPSSPTIFIRGYTRLHPPKKMQEFCVDGTAVRFYNQDEVDNTGAKRVWDAAVVLTGMFADPAVRRKMVVGKKVVELGAGLGYLAGALAVLGAEVVATEMEELLPVLRRNTNRAVENAKGDGKLCTHVQVARLDWTTAAEDIPKLPVQNFDMIVASDVIYIEDYLTPFLHSIELLLESSPRAHVYVAVDVRDENLCTTFERRLAEDVNLKVKSVPKKKLPAPYNQPEWAHALILHGRRSYGGAKDEA